MVKSLVVLSNQSDGSYQPREFKVLGGSNEHDMVELSHIALTSRVNEITLLRDCKAVYPIIRIRILRNHSNGVDCRVRARGSAGTADRCILVLFLHLTETSLPYMYRFEESGLQAT